MATKQGRNHGQPFTCLVGNFPYGSYPDHNMPIYQNPPPNRQAITHQILTIGDKRTSAQNYVALLAGAISPKVASLTVANDDFTTGTTVITLGDFTLTSDIDYVTGGGAAVTAANLAAAITALPGFTATVPAGAQVDIEYGYGPANQVDFNILYNGTITNFTPVTPDTGLMDNGGPNFAPPDLI
jgi:hypothetical protein